MSLPAVGFDPRRPPSPARHPKNHALVDDPHLGERFVYVADHSIPKDYFFDEKKKQLVFNSQTKTRDRFQPSQGFLPKISKVRHSNHAQPRPIQPRSKSQNKVQSYEGLWKKSQKLKAISDFSNRYATSSSTYGSFYNQRRAC
mmetsp:Transcript_30114/g.58967  ORF Transcript_30114/g.58967 Transcript_30114/m.58967 type:complete len:143 (-) Transcript_30114:309-737(-)